MKFAIIGKSLLELREIYGIGNGGFYDNNWWLKESFAKDKPESGIYEIELEYKRLDNLVYKDQVQKLEKGFEVPHPAVIVEALLSHYKITKQYLMKDWYSNTSILTWNGPRVGVGYCDANGVCVDYWRGDSRGDIVGLAACRKLSNLDPGVLELFLLGS